MTGRTIATLVQLTLLFAAIFAVIIPRSVNSKYMNLILEIWLGLDKGLGLILKNQKPTTRSNSNLISRIMFVYLGFTEHGIIT